MAAFANQEDSETIEISPLNRLRLVTGLTRLVEINEERLQEYRMALDEMKEFPLQTVLQRYVNQCHEFINSLSEMIKAHGGDYTRPVLKSRRKSLWHGLMHFLLVPDKEEILRSCEYRESIAVKNYKHIMKIHQWPYDILLMLRMQKEQIEDAFNEITSFSGVDVLYE
jgi:uncharacterized protein (TIGR02284 family)